MESPDGEDKEAVRIVRESAETRAWKVREYIRLLKGPHLNERWRAAEALGEIRDLQQ